MNESFAGILLPSTAQEISDYCFRDWLSPCECSTWTWHLHIPQHLSLEWNLRDKVQNQKYGPRYQNQSQKQLNATFGADHIHSSMPPAEERWYDIYPGCGQMFHDPTALRNHWSRTHIHEEKFEQWYDTCPDCGQMFYDPNALQKHWSSTHDPFVK